MAAKTGEKRGNVHPVISGGRTLSKALQGGKSSSGGKVRKKRSTWGENNGQTSAAEGTARTDRIGAAGKNVKSRLLPCGHYVLMLKCQRPTTGECPTCKEPYNLTNGNSR